MPTLTWLSGFEHGVTPLHATNNALVQAIMTNAPVLDSTIKRSGTYSCKFAPTSAVDWGFQMTAASVQIHVFSFAIYWETLPSGAGTDPRGIFAQIDGGGGANYMGIGVDPADNTLRSWHHNGVSLTWQNTGPVVTTGVWYQVDVLIKTNGTTWSVDYELNGESYQGTWTGKAATNATANFNAFCSTATRHVLYVDDFLYSNTEADYPLGQHAVVQLVPSGAADHQTITTTQWKTVTDTDSDWSAGATTADFTGATETTSAPLLDDLSNLDGISMVAGAGGQAGNGRWNLNNPAHPSQLPVALRSYMYVREAASGTNDATLRLRAAGGSTVNIFAGNPTWATTWTYLVLLSSSVPGGSGWTMADVEGLTLEMDSTDSAPNIWVAGYVGEMAYKIGSLIWMPTPTIARM